MSKSANPIPSGYHAVTPYLVVGGAADAIEFYKKAFGAEEVLRMPGPDGSVGHADIIIGDSHVMLSDELPAMGFVGPRTLNGSPVLVHLYVEDADAVFARAVDAGAKSLMPVQDQFYGDRVGSLEDPFGHVWYVSTHVEDLPIEELEKRAAVAAAQSP